MPNLTTKDLEKFITEHPDYQMELVGGEIIVMSTSGLESDEVAAMIITLLLNWVRPWKLGRVTASSAGFRLPNADGDIRAPDAAFIRSDRLPQTTENYAEIVPDLIFEVKSKTDSVTKLQEKIQQFLTYGTTVGVLVDPRTRTMEVYRLNTEKVVLGDGDVLQVPELLPGWELPVLEVWAPEF
ncbi:MAG: Uma2 family endonuclease [Okeania sp. SIO3C4]|nr:Uma2 family endonuclease [Okeania sp. SIO3B3]NER03385.1 Uma2 family endonuclease [Okeania sp. SIO3C4]